MSFSATFRVGIRTLTPTSGVGLLRLLLLVVWMPTMGIAQTLATGGRIATFTVHDQHDQEHTLNTEVSLLLFSRDMDGGDVIKAGLKGFTQQQLDEKHVVFLSDISAMPGFVATVFAKPKMRKSAYTMWLDEDGDITAKLPGEEGHASLIFLHDLQITSVEITDQPERVHAALAALSTTGPSRGDLSD